VFNTFRLGATCNRIGFDRTFAAPGSTINLHSQTRKRAGWPHLAAGKVQPEIGRNRALAANDASIIRRRERREYSYCDAATSPSGRAHTVFEGAQRSFGALAHRNDDLLEGHGRDVAGGVDARNVRAAVRVHDDFSKAIEVE
jgi:hypothetical protein